jgi:hypothetical protein
MWVSFDQFVNLSLGATISIGDKDFLIARFGVLDFARQ